MASKANLFSRRALLGAFPFLASAQIKPPFRKAKPLPAVGEFTRVIDPVTENTIVRLTALTSSCVLPYPRGRFVSSSERALIFSSDRSGHFAPYQLDLRTGGIRQIADPLKLQPRSVSLDRQEKSVHYLDGTSLFEVALSRGNPRLVAEGVTSFSTASDGSLFIISAGKLIRRMGSNPLPLADAAVNAWPQPDGGGCVFSRATGPDEGELYFVPSDGSAKPSLLAAGRLRDPWWDADGQSILFLRDVTSPNGTLLAEVHGRAIRGGGEYVVSPTSQFACFSVNSDASVFVGASRSRAQPNVVLLLRTPYREMTLCQHKSSHPGEVFPVFSPDNRRIYFESDSEGRPALYSVNVELLVEPH